ncbi:MAG: pilus assembly protein TadG-related protein [Clostridia bacterium]|nr:pilus assembly protein TadG-related protein [Clostridia bacterium]MDD4047530.1 pilus assembly protein TadG-related protein [Clostridia bacterium]
MKVKLLKNNRGSVIVLLALSMTVILGCCAFVIDTGRGFLEKTRFQNAIDATCLAAAQDLPNTSEAINTAHRYIKLNGYEPTDISITFSDSNKTINIVGNKKIEYFFAKVLDQDSVTIHPNASAVVESIGGAFNYSLFSGSSNSILVLNGSHQYIEGSSHSNYKFIINGANQTITEACEAVSTITVNGSKINIGNKVPNAPFVEMPDFSETIKIQADNAGQVYTGNKSYNGSYIKVDSPIYVKGNVTVNGSHFIGKGCILATGDITFNGSNLNSSSEDAVCFYSQNGDIIINGAHTKLNGIVYAPNGRIIMNGTKQTVNGRVIGNEVVLNGSNMSIISGTSELESLPTGSVKLTE